MKSEVKHGIEVHDSNGSLLERWTFPTYDEYRSFCSGLNMGIRMSKIEAKKITHIGGSSAAVYANAREDA